MNEPYMPGLIYLASPFPSPSPPPRIVPPTPAPSPVDLERQLRHMTIRAGAHGPCIVPAAPAPAPWPPALSPAYFALPYSYAYPAPSLATAMPHNAFVPLLSRIQLTRTDTTEPRRTTSPPERGRSRGRSNRAEDTVTRVAASVEGEDRQRWGSWGGRRSASPKRRDTRSDERRRNKSAAPLLDRLSSRGRQYAAVPLADRFSDPPAPRDVSAPPQRRPLLARLSSPVHGRSPSPPSSPTPVRRTTPQPATAHRASLDCIPSTTFHFDRPDREVRDLRAHGGRLRAVRDDNGGTCFTTVPIREGPELFWYLADPFEDDVDTPALRLPWEHSAGPAPRLLPACLRSVPPSSILLHHHWGPFRLAQWKRYGPQYISNMMGLDAWSATAEARTMSEWAEALRPGGDARRILGTDPDQWTDEVLFRVGLFPASEQEVRAMIWENDTHLFRRDFEQLAARLHGTLRRAHGHERGEAWALVRDSIRRMWGPGLDYFPDAHEAAFLDSEDELVRMRHWRAMGRLILQWDLPEHLRGRVHLATGGTVRRLERDLQDVLDELAGLELGREMHAFPYRRLGARIVT